MPEPDARAELDQARVLRGNHVVGADAQPAGGLRDHPRVTDGLGRRDEQGPLRLGRKRLHAAQEGLLDPAGQLTLVG